MCDVFSFLAGGSAGDVVEGSGCAKVSLSLCLRYICSVFSGASRKVRNQKKGKGGREIIIGAISQLPHICIRFIFSFSLSIPRGHMNNR